MKSQFDHILLSSFYLWFENELLSSRSKAYIANRPNTFKHVSAFDIPTGFVAYQGGYRQLVAEQSIDTPNTGVFVNGNAVSASASNFYIDNQNGRIILPAASGVNLAITGLSTVKEINTYVTNDDDEQLIMHGDFRELNQTNPYWFGKDDKLDEKTYFLPACFISLATSSNEPFSFGGEEDTQTRIRVVVLTEDEYLLNGVLSFFKDSVRKCITHIPYGSYPYGRFNSVKNYPYEYEALVAAQPDDGSKRSYIEKVMVSKIVNSDLRKNLGKNFAIGFLDFDLSTYRFPRI